MSILTLFPFSTLIATSPLEVAHTIVTNQLSAVQSAWLESALSAHGMEDLAHSLERIRQKGPLTNEEQLYQLIERDFGKFQSLLAGYSPWKFPSPKRSANKVESRIRIGPDGAVYVEDPPQNSAGEKRMASSIWGDVQSRFGRTENAAEIYRRQGLKYLQNREYKDAAEVLRKEVTERKKLGDETKLETARNDLIRSLVALGEYGNAAKIHEDLGEYRQAGRYWKWEGDAYTIQQNHEEAAKAYEQSQELFNKGKNPFLEKIANVWINSALNRTSKKEETREKLKNLSEGKTDAMVPHEIVQFGEDIGEIIDRGIEKIKSSSLVPGEPLSIEISEYLQKLALFAMGENITFEELLEVARAYPFREGKGGRSLIVHLQIYALLKSQLDREKLKDPETVKGSEFLEKEKLVGMLERGQIEVVVRAGSQPEEALRRHGDGTCTVAIDMTKRGAPTLETMTIANPLVPFKNFEINWEPQNPLLSATAAGIIFGRLRHELFHPSETQHLLPDALSIVESLRFLAARYNRETAQAYAKHMDQWEKDELKLWIKRVLSLKAVSSKRENISVFSQMLLEPLVKAIDQLSAWSEAMNTVPEKGGEPRWEHLGKAIEKYVYARAAILFLNHLLGRFQYSQEMKLMLVRLQNEKKYVRCFYPVLGRLPVRVPFSMNMEKTTDWFEKDGVEIWGRRYRLPSGDILQVLEDKSLSDEEKGHILRTYYTIAILYYGYLKEHSVMGDNFSYGNDAISLLQHIFSGDVIFRPDFLKSLRAAPADGVSLEEERYRFGHRSPEALDYIEDAGKQLQDQKKEKEKYDFEREAEAFQKAGAFGEVAQRYKWYGDQLVLLGDTAKAVSVYARAANYFQQDGDVLGEIFAALYQGGALLKSGNPSEAQEVGRSILSKYEANLEWLSFKKRADELSGVLHSRKLFDGADIEPIPVAEETQSLLQILSQAHVENVPTDSILNAAENYKFYFGKGIRDVLTHLKVLVLLKGQLIREKTIYPGVAESGEYKQREHMVELMEKGLVECHINNGMEGIAGRTGRIHKIERVRVLRNLDENDMGIYKNKKVLSEEDVQEVELNYHETPFVNLDIATMGEDSNQTLGDVAAHEIWGHARARRFNMIWKDKVEEERYARVAGLRHYTQARYGSRVAEHYAKNSMDLGWANFGKLVQILEGAGTAFQNKAGEREPLFPKDTLWMMMARIHSAPIGEWVFKIANDISPPLEIAYDQAYRVIEGLKLLFEKATIVGIANDLLDELEKIQVAANSGGHYQSALNRQKGIKISLSDDPEAVKRQMFKEGISINGHKIYLDQPDAILEKWSLERHDEVVEVAEIYYQLTALYYHYLVNLGVLSGNTLAKNDARWFFIEYIFGKLLEDSPLLALSDLLYISANHSAVFHQGGRS